MNTAIQFTIDTDKCISCGACAADCPRQIISMDTYPRITDEKKCMRCQHCLAICPVGALSILGHTPAQSTPLKGTLPDPQQLTTLMKGRRSVRHYSHKDIDTALLQEILEAAGHAPTGTNSQQTLVTVIDKRAVMEAFRHEVYARMGELVDQNRLPECPLHNFFLLAPKLWKEHGQDSIFRTAPHCLIVSNSQNASCVQEDPLIYLSYFELAAQSRGIGTVWCGILYYCLNYVLPDLKQRLGIPENHRIGYTMLFGQPAVEYYRTVERGAIPLNTVSCWNEHP